VISNCRNAKCQWAFLRVEDPAAIWISYAHCIREHLFITLTVLSVYAFNLQMFANCLDNVQTHSSAHFSHRHINVLNHLE
jgi:hypothetical protein